jgi:hypothetical protein
MFDLLSKPNVTGAKVYSSSQVYLRVVVTTGWQCWYDQYERANEK